MNSVPPTEIPSDRSLFRSTLIAAAVAIVLLVTVVMPAEYGVDPTRIGRLLGLTRMGEIKVALAKEAAAADSADAAAKAASAGTAAASAAAPPPAVPVPGSSSGASTRGDTPPRSDVTQIALRPNEGKEIKLVMRKDARVSYSWSTDRGVVNYDTHADAPGIRYYGYAKGTATRADSGVLVAAFDGAHGWFWRNRGTAAVTVTLRTDGDYQEIKRVD